MPAVNLLHYPDGERREWRRWWWGSLGLGALLGVLGMQALTWQMEERMQLHEAKRRQQQATQTAQAEQAREVKVQQQLHERRLRWQSKVQRVFDDQAQAGQMWQILPQLSAQHGLTWSRLQWSADHWTLQGKAADMAAVVRVRESLLAQLGVHSELKTWAIPVPGKAGTFQLEWTWSTQVVKP